ncbi:MAG: hypothetical protein LBM96_00705 [Methanobrevibacter sp.]|jgi:hypothetical protein|nr:hypothetical protein [Candidatus Methanoflexus mossambicus]
MTINIETYGFTDEDIDLIIFSINKDEKTFNIDSEEKYKELATQYLQSSIDWLNHQDTLITEDDGTYATGLKFIARQIAINMFMNLDVNQMETIINTEYSTSIPSSKSEIITPQIQTLLEPYLTGESKKGNDTITILNRRSRDFGF